MTWLTYEPRPQDIPTAREMVEAGFTERMARIQRVEAERHPSWPLAMDWWQNLDTHLRMPRGLLAWSNPGVVETFTVICRRLMCWQHLPVPKGISVSPVRFVEALDLHDDEHYSQAAAAGTLFVGGVGTIKYGEDKEVERILGLAKQRLRAGKLTLWHLDPVGTERSVDVCRRLDAHLGDTVYRVGDWGT